MTRAGRSAGTGRRQALRPADDGDARPSLKGEARIGRGQRALPVFHLLAERYLDPRYSPDAVAPQTGIPAATIRRIAAELAHAAFREAITLDIPWTDVWGNRHERMVGRPVSMHAMRGISAHSNGFHTCRALHLLQALLGSIDVPGGFRFKPPFPKPAPPGPKPAGRPGQVAPGQPMPGPPLGYPAGPEDLLVEADGTPLPDRQGVLLGGAARRARHDAHGDHQRLSRRSLPDRHAVPVHGQHGLELGHERRRHDRDADRQGPGQRRLPHPAHHLCRCLLLGDGRLCRPDPAGHHLSRALGLHLAARPADLVGRRPGGCDPPAGARSRIATSGRSRTCCSIWARGSACRAWSTRRATQRFPKGYPDYLVHHERKPGIGSLAGWRGDGSEHGRGAPNPDQLQRYVEHGCFWQDELAPGQRYFKHANRDYLDYAVRMGFIDRAAPVTFQLYSEVLQKFRLAAQGASRAAAAARAPGAHRDLLRSPAVLVSAARPRRRAPVPDARGHPAADGDVPFLGLAERLAAADPFQQPPLSRPRARRRDGPARWRLGLDHQPARPDQGADPADGRRQSGHLLDLERDRQARRRLAPSAAGARRRPRASCSTT